MRRSWSVLITGLALMLAADKSAAHHWFSAEFDINKPITLKGTLNRMDWVNPHGWIYVDATLPVPAWNAACSLARSRLQRHAGIPGRVHDALECVSNGNSQRDPKRRGNGRSNARIRGGCDGADCDDADNARIDTECS